MVVFLLTMILVSNSLQDFLGHMQINAHTHTHLDTHTHLHMDIEACINKEKGDLYKHMKGVLPQSRTDCFIFTLNVCHQWKWSTPRAPREFILRRKKGKKGEKKKKILLE